MIKGGQAMLEIAILGFLFGAFIVYGRLNKYDTISGLATLEDLTVAKALLVAVGLGIVLLSFEISLGLASYHVKPFVLGGVIIGGIAFGIGMAVLGYCPGTLVISAGEGSLDAIIGIIGGLSGGLVFTISLPSIKGILGPSLGKVSAASFVGNNSLLYFLIAVAVGVFMIYLAFFLNKREGRADKKWLYSGVLLGLLDPIVFLKAVENRPIGASTAYPYLFDRIGGLTSSPYFIKIQKPGHWEVVFLTGALIAGFVIAIVKGEFSFKLIHSRWEKYKGSSVLKRVFYSFLGGFILIFGARMAGGCTSGHILSGGMQLAISSLVFALFAFLSLVITGRLFYRKGHNND